MLGGWWLAAAIGCVSCWEDAFGPGGSGDTVRQMLVVVRDDLAGQETTFKAEGAAPAFAAPHGFKCRLERTTRAVTPESGDQPRLYVLSCEKGGERTAISHGCGVPASERRWSGQAANGMTVATVILRCAFAT